MNKSSKIFVAGHRGMVGSAIVRSLQAMQDGIASGNAEAQRGHLSLAQLKALQPGQTLALQRPAQEYVTIRANGMPIGTGQLVDIDGRLGVAVGSLMPSTVRPAAE